MNSYFKTDLPNEDFWNAYHQLWLNSGHCSPFQAAAFISYLAKRYKNNLGIYQCYQGQKLVGAAFFRRDKGVYIFLSQVKSDHNCFVLDEDCSASETEAFFQHFFTLIKKKKFAFILNNHPSWFKYTPSFTRIGEESGLFWDSAPYSVCPTLEEASGQSLFDRFHQSKELRYRVNRLKNQQEAKFEIFRGDEDLEEWVQDFCRLHILRWQATTTPSRYLQPGQQTLLLECLKAWIEDGSLVRFSIKIAEGNRIGFVICLIHGETLIHHTTAYDDCFRKYSPGKALLYIIGEWMAKENLKNLDFGKGKEAYKYEFINTEPELNRIFVASHRHIPFILKAKISKKIREHQELRTFYKNKIKPFFQD